jgi:TM2 domain-containing membrane protein YozV
MQGQYQEASLLHERTLFLVNDNTGKAKALLKKSFCQKALGRHEKALKSLQRVNTRGVADSLHAEVLYQLAFNAYMSGMFSESIFYTQQMQLYGLPDTSSPRTHLVKAMAHLEKQEYEKSYQAARSVIIHLNQGGYQQDSLLKCLEELYLSENLPNLKKEEKAVWLSTFIPGSGQMYAGRPGEGIFNLALHLGTLAFAGVQIYLGYYLTGYFGGLALFQRFYFGNTKRAAELVGLYNEKEMARFAGEAKKFLTGVVDGVK